MKISKQSPSSRAYAAAVVKTILNIAPRLTQFPFAGRIVPELADHNIREWFAYSYRIIYQIENQVVTVATVIHGKRQFTIRNEEF